MTHTSPVHKPFDVVALGAIAVDLQVEAHENTIDDHGLQKSFTNTVSPEKQAIIAASGGTLVLRAAGGAGGNVVCGIAAHGGSAALVGKIGNDDHGQFYANRMREHGVHYQPLLPADGTIPTTSIMVLMTPDRERTFAFVPGAGVHLTPDDIDESLIAQAKIVYLDAYLWLSETGRHTVHHAADVAKGLGTKVAIAINDAKLTEINRVALLDLAQKHGDIIVGDRREFMALMGTDNLDDAFALAKTLLPHCVISVTAGAKGALIFDQGTVTAVPAVKVEKIADTNGAGDQFAAGLLHGLATGKTPVEAAHQGAHWAAEIIQKIGAEPHLRGSSTKAAKPSHNPKHKAA